MSTALAIRTDDQLIRSGSQGGKERDVVTLSYHQDLCTVRLNGYTAPERGKERAWVSAEYA